MASNMQPVYTLPPQSSPQKKSLEWGCMQLCSKQSSKGPSSKIIYGYWWLFDCNTCRVSALGCLKKKKDNSDFWPFQVRYYLCYCILGAAYNYIISSSKCLWTLAFTVRWNYCHINAIILWLEPPSCFWVIPTYGLSYHEPIIPLFCLYLNRYAIYVWVTPPLVGILTVVQYRQRHCRAIVVSCCAYGCSKHFRKCCSNGIPTISSFSEYLCLTWGSREAT